MVVWVCESVCRLLCGLCKWFGGSGRMCDRCCIGLCWVGKWVGWSGVGWVRVGLGGMVECGVGFGCDVVVSSGCER